MGLFCNHDDDTDDLCVRDLLSYDYVTDNGGDLA